MKYALMSMLLIVGFFPAALSAAPAAPADSLIAELTGDAPAKARSPEEFAAACGEVVKGLLPSLGADNTRTQNDAQSLLQRIAFRASRPGAEAERSAFCSAMAGALSSPSTPAARVWLLRQLERSGRAECVAALATSASDADALVRETARRALAANPSPDAAEALRKLIAGATEPAAKASLLEALACHADPRDVALFAKELSSSQDAIRIAAALALGKVGDATAVDSLAGALSTGSEIVRGRAEDALAAISERLAGSDKAACLAVCRQLLKGSPQARCAGLIGLGRAGGEAEQAVLLESLIDPDWRIACAAMQGLENMKGPPVTQAMLARADKLAPAALPAFILALGGRGDKEALPFVIKAVAAAPAPPTTRDAAPDPSIMVRQAAYSALATLGDASAVGVLIDAAIKAKGDEQKLAREALDSIRAEDINPALVVLTSKGAGPQRAEAMRALAGRGVASAIADLLKSINDPDPAVKSAAVSALGSLARPEHLPIVIDAMLKAPNDADLDLLARAAVDIYRRSPDPSAQLPLVVAAMQKTRGPGRAALIRGIGRAGGEQALKMVRDGLKSEDPDMREAAVRSLCDWPDDAAMPDLLAIAGGKVEGLAPSAPVLALRGYVRRVQATASGRPQPQTLELYKNALAAAQRPEEKRLVLGPLGEMRLPEAAGVLAGYLSDEAVADDAAGSIIKIAKSQKNAPAVRQALGRILESKAGEPLREEARSLLDH